MTAIRRARVGDIARLRREPVAVDPLAAYREIGVRSFGKGIFHKEPVTGADLAEKRVFEIHPGDLVLNNVFAWEGAVALATELERGMIGSHRFMTYVPDTGESIANYLRYFFLCEQGLDLLRRASPGSAGRNRTLNISAFESLEIPLPDLEEQRRIAAKLDRLLSTTQAAVNLVSRAGDLAAPLFDGLATRIMSRADRRILLAEVAEINPAPDPVSATELISFVPMAAVDDVTGTITAAQTKLRGEVNPGYKQFRRGDVIFARITPCMQNGKSAVASMATAWGYGSTEFHVIRPGPSVLSEWIHGVVRTSAFRDDAQKGLTGTAGQQRVPADFLREVSIPVPESVDHQRSLLVDVDRVLDSGRRTKDLLDSQYARLKALGASVLNQAFNGGL